MKSYKYFLAVGLTLMLSGCDQNVLSSPQPEESVATDSANSSGGSSVETYVSPLPADAPVVKVSTEANYAPYEFKDEYGNVIGFDVDLIRAIGESQGFRVEIYNDPWEEVFTNLENGSRDMIAAGLTYSDERASKYALSKSYAPTPSSLAYLDSNITVNSLEDISVLDVGVLSNSNPYRYFSENPQFVNNLQEFPTVFSAVQAMVRGEVNVVAADDGVLRYTLNNYPELKPTFYTYEDIASEGGMTVYAVRKGNPELLKLLNDGIDKVKQNGTYGQITKKWFGEDLTETLELQLQQVASGTIN